MTDEQRRKRMQEIDAERDKLKDELREHEQYFYAKKKEERLQKCYTYVNKCFKFPEVSITDRAPFTNIMALKILSLSELFNEPRATCLVLYKDYKGMHYEVLDLWSPAVLTKMPMPFIANIIDDLAEITQEEFNSLRDEVIRHLVKL